MKKPNFYYMDLNNYTDEFLREIIILQKEELDEWKNLPKMIKVSDILTIIQKRIEILNIKIHQKSGGKKCQKLYGIWQELINFYNEIAEMTGEKQYYGRD